MRKLILILIISFNIYGAEIYSDYSLEFKNRYLDLNSKINPNNCFELDEGYQGNFELYYKGDLYYKDVLLKISNNSIYDISKNEFDNNLLEFYGSIELFENYLDFGKKRNVRSVAFLKEIIDFPDINNNSYDRNERKRYSEGKTQVGYEIFKDFGVFTFEYYPEINLNNKLEENLSLNQNQGGKFVYTDLVGDLEYTILAEKRKNINLGGNMSTTVSNNLELHIEAGYLGEVDRYDLSKKGITGDIFELKLDKDEKTSQGEFISGFHYIKGDYSIIGEYYYNSYGFNSKGWNKRLEIIKESRKLYDNKDKYNEIGDSIYGLTEGNLGKTLNMLSNNRIGNICRNYLMLRISVNSIKDLGLSITNILNLQDKSGMVILSTSFLRYENLEIKLSSNVNFGPVYSEYRLMGEDKKFGLDIKWRF